MTQFCIEHWRAWAPGLDSEDDCRAWSAQPFIDRNDAQIDHFRKGNDGLANLMGLDLALTHPMVIVEIACGTPPAPRAETLQNIALLQQCNQASLGEVVEFIEREKLYGLGCGLVGIALLASTLMTPGTELWTLDKRLAELAERFGVAHYPAQH